MMEGRGITENEGGIKDYKEKEKIHARWGL